MKSEAKINRHVVNTIKLKMDRLAAQVAEGYRRMLVDYLDTYHTRSGRQRDSVQVNQSGKQHLEVSTGVYYTPFFEAKTHAFEKVTRAFMETDGPALVRKLV